MTGVKLKSQRHGTAKRPAPKRRPLEAGKPDRNPPPLKTVDALLDEALGDTFPASDPVALTTPHRPAARKRGTTTRKSRRYTE